MCGIAGIVSSDAREYIEKLTEVLAHRGPDDFGYYIEGNLALGHRRLSIMDLSENGHQPMTTEDNTYVIVFNGEIYNHLEIRKSLLEYDFKSHSDTETILYGYKKFGIKLLNMLNGIFSFTIFNKQTRELIVVRDHFGVKPLYYCIEEKYFIFSSELKSLIKYPKLSLEIDYNALSNYINFLWSPGEQTPLINVKKLLPGHYIKFNVEDLSSFVIKEYYDIPFDGKYLTANEEQLVDELDRLLENAVKRQLLADVPVGYFLSGGLDSSLIVAYGRKINPNMQIDCFTIDTGEVALTEGFSNDLYYAKKVATHLGVKLNIVDADIEIVKEFDKMIYHLDEPQADAAPLNVYNICKKAREMGYKVLLGGTGGDDLFSGYRRHQVIQLERFYKYVPKVIGKFLKTTSAFLSTNNAVFRRIRKALSNVDKSKIQRMAGYFEWIPLNVNHALFNPTLLSKIKLNTPENYLINLLKNIPNEQSDLNRMLYWEMKTFLVDHNLNYTDKLGMAAGIEIRVPFLDKELVEFSTKLPVHLKLRGNVTKYILKKVAEKYLPKEVIYRSKAGFGAPVRKWVTQDMDAMINERLSNLNISRRGIFNPEAIHNLIEKNKSGRIDVSYTIWSLLAIDSWYRQFIESEKK